MAAAITGSVVYVDNGYHAMGMAVSPESLKSAEG
jgi:enoyl-[acyl-carrier-protein] reductase (NADH)